MKKMDMQDARRELKAILEAIAVVCRGSVQYELASADSSGTRF
jgi:hypothetical protein